MQNLSDPKNQELSESITMTYDIIKDFINCNDEIYDPDILCYCTLDKFIEWTITQNLSIND